MMFCSKSLVFVVAICTGLAVGAASSAGEITGRGFPVRSSQSAAQPAQPSVIPSNSYSSSVSYSRDGLQRSSGSTPAPHGVSSYNPNQPGDLATLAPLAEAPVVSTPMPNDTRAYEAQPLSFPDNPRRKRNGEERREFSMPSIWPPLLSVMAVCGLFCAVLYLMKKYLPGHRQLFSHPAMEVLGRTHLDQKRYVSLLRVGKRIVVVGVSPDEMRPLSEITDEEEITSIMEVARPKTEAGLTIFQKLFKRSVQNAEAAETRAMARVKAEQLDEQMDSLRRRVRDIGKTEKPRRREATVDTIG